MKLPILCYHKVGPIAEEGRRLNIEPERLASHAAFFSRRGYRFVLPHDLVNRWPAHGVCFTFDDGYVSTATYGVDALVREGGLGAIYVVTSLVGKVSSWDVGNERPLADYALLKTAQSAGFEIGNHTRSHARLGDLTVEAQTDEISSTSDDLAAHGFDRPSCCLPYGSHNESTIAAMRQAGVAVNLALSRRSAQTGDNLLLMPRIVIAFGDGLAGLLYKLYVRPHLPSLKRRRDYV